MKKQFTKEKIKQKIKENSSILVLFVLMLVMLFPVPYYITVGGGVMGMDEKITVIGEKEKEGSLGSCYVKELKGTVASLLLSYVVPGYERTKISDVVIEGEDVEDYDFREKLEFTSSYEVAKKNAFEALGKSVVLKVKKIHVIAKAEEAKTTLEVQDQILAIENKEVGDLDAIKEILKTHQENDEISILVLRDGEEVMTTTTLYKENDEVKLGIYLMSEYAYETDPKVELSVSNKESGPSGGLMMSLAIYNKLSDEDITGGKKVVGTGTIDDDGKVGEIGGVKFKIRGAIKEKADVFLVPKENYDEAKKELDEHETNMKLIVVETFADALSKLKDIR